MPSRFFTDFSANASTFIGIPSYTGAITYKCYPRANNAGLPNSPTVVLNQWNTFTTSVTALTEIGRGFNGVISDISGAGLNIPVALSTGIEAPATLNGAGFTQYECEELNGGVLAVGIPVYIDPNGQFVNTPNGQPFLSGCTISGGNIIFGKTTIAPPAVIYRAPSGGVTTTPNGDPIAEFIA